MKKIIVISSLFCVILATYLAYQPGWNNYYKKKLYLPPAQVTQDVLQRFPKTGVAVDLGCGCGNDTAFLLNNGWTVWAIDGEQQALELLRKRIDIFEQDHLFTISQKFETLQWDEVPKVHLLLAIHSLPFCNRQKFQEVWSHIVNKIEPEGRFVGHFFGPSYQGFTEKERRSMTFLSKEEVAELFQNFEIELFEETKDAGKSGTGRSIHSHIFTVVAKKNSSSH